jgi:hypothetical protein
MIRGLDHIPSDKTGVFPSKRGRLFQPTVYLVEHIAVTALALGSAPTIENAAIRYRGASPRGQSNDAIAEYAARWVPSPWPPDP